MSLQPNGLRYPLVGGTRQRHFAGTNFKPHKLPENAQTPTSRVHAVLGGLLISLMGLLSEGKHPLQYQYTWYQRDVQPEPPQLTWR